VEVGSNRLPSVPTVSHSDPFSGLALSRGERVARCPDALHREVGRVRGQLHGQDALQGCFAALRMTAARVAAIMRLRDRRPWASARGYSRSAAPRRERLPVPVLIFEFLVFLDRRYDSLMP
jgi:hypothetical protein